MNSILNRRKALLGSAATAAALAMPAVVAAEISPEPALMSVVPADPDAELAALGAEFDRLDAAIAETNSALEPTDEEAERLRDQKPAAMKFTGRDYLWFDGAGGVVWDYWSLVAIDTLRPSLPRDEWDNPAPRNARIAELKEARAAWAYRNREFSIRSGRFPLLERLEALYANLDTVERHIVALPAATLSGIVVKARAGKRESTLWDRPMNDLDYDEQFLRDLIDNVLALAAVRT